MADDFKSSGTSHPTHEYLVFDRTHTRVASTETLEEALEVMRALPVGETVERDGIVLGFKARPGGYKEKEERWTA